MHVGYTAAFQNPFDALLGPGGLRAGDAALRPRRRARLRVAVVGRAPLRRLHDVSRHRAVALLLGRQVPERAAGLRRRRAALARPAAGGRAAGAPRQHVRRADDLRHRPGPGPHRVRGLPGRHEHVARAARRVHAAGARRPRDRLHGVRQRVRHPAPPPDPSPAGALVQGPGLRRRGVARVDAAHGAARRRRAGHPPEALGRGGQGPGRVPPGLQRGERQRRHRRPCRAARRSSTRAPTGPRRWPASGSGRTTARSCATTSSPQPRTRG